MHSIHRRTLVMLCAVLVCVERGTAGQTPASAGGDGLRWRDIREFGVEGRGWTDTKAFYDRLPARAEGVVRPAVWSLSHHSAGMCVRFTTDATAIHVPAASSPTSPHAA